MRLPRTISRLRYARVITRVVTSCSSRDELQDYLPRSVTSLGKLC